jgi:hypothetical protein
LYVDYNDDQSSDEDENKEKRKKFLIAVAKDSISVVNFSDNYKKGEEFPVVKLNKKTEYDRIEDLFITYQRKKKRITLHYFEKIFEYEGQLKQSTYNQYELSEDFLSVLFSTGELIPNEQSRMIKRIKEIKTPPDHLIDMTAKERALNDLAESLGVTQKDLDKLIKGEIDEDDKTSEPVKDVKDEKPKLKELEKEDEFKTYKETMKKIVDEAEGFLKNSKPIDYSAASDENVKAH